MLCEIINSGIQPIQNLAVLKKHSEDQVREFVKNNVCILTHALQERQEQEQKQEKMGKYRNNF